MYPRTTAFMDACDRAIAAMDAWWEHGTPGWKQATKRKGGAAIRLHLWRRDRGAAPYELAIHRPEQHSPATSAHEILQRQQGVGVLEAKMHAACAALADAMAAIPLLSESAVMYVGLFPRGLKDPPEVEISLHHAWIKPAQRGGNAEHAPWPAIQPVLAEAIARLAPFDAPPSQQWAVLSQRHPTPYKTNAHQQAYAIWAGCPQGAAAVAGVWEALRFAGNFTGPSARSTFTVFPLHHAAPPKRP